MTLIRKLFFICASYNYEKSAKYLTSKSNILAHALSRGTFIKFYQCCDSPNNMVQCKAYDVLKDLYFTDDVNDLYGDVEHNIRRTYNYAQKQYLLYCDKYGFNIMPASEDIL
eukprot:GHVU01002304.1.p1 GENE.GHVU01002304.1~~GHVU01002304.1.p1  ORF type:complete len:112 (-),score=9.24 GHVU01002304.1:135-470(-)